uniref:NAC transcription factor 079 n=1 Tax=Rhizophora mucronata TaxID=61149 RepID=A0A2P2PQ69_RHIMU
MEELPPGFRFLPTDEQLVGVCLYENVTGTLPPSHGFLIKHHDLYGQEEPWEIWERFWTGGPFFEDLYFFTILKKKSANGSRVDRRTGSTAGYWHRVNSGTKIEVDDYVKEEYSASKKTFVYRNPTSDEHDVWRMDEYSLELEGKRSENGDCVLCSLRKIGAGDSLYSLSGESADCDCAHCRWRRRQEFSDDEDD